MSPFPMSPSPLPRRTRAKMLVGASCMLALMACVAASRVAAADPAANSLIGSGTLMLSAKGVAGTIPAMRLGTDMDVAVSGQIARVKVVQAFRNTSSKWMEASYLYPLPDDSAVDSLKMVVGQRVIIGHVKRREEARKIYETAKASGKKAGLVEEERANMFRNSVANVAPGETVLIAIEYQAPVHLAGGEFSLRLPLVVGPRYVPPHGLTSPAALADAAAVDAPLADPKLGKSLNPVSITVHLAAGFRPANIISPYHQVTVADDGGDMRTVRLASGQVPADRDFELRWRSASADPTLGLFRQPLDGQDYLMASITPPAPDKLPPVPPREMLFVIDNSGSMGGASMDEAKAGLLHGLDTLRPDDSFNIIRFDDTMTQLFVQPMKATPDQIATARRFVNGLQASGGTEMLPALKAALADRTPDAKMLRQIVFLTDGDLSNEKEMMQAIVQHGGRSRIFMVGIGSAPNNFLMARMAEAGRGTYTNIGSGEEVAARMTDLLDKLQRPAVHDITVTVNGAPLDLLPHLLPDLYAGEPLVLLGRGGALKGRLTVSGLIGETPWTQSVDLGDAAQSPSIARLWASRKIADVEAARASSQTNDATADETIARIGLAYSLVTSQTSLVAVDETPSRAPGETLTKEELPLLLPAGWDFDTLFGGDAGKVAMDAENNLGGAAAPIDEMQGLNLPQTATGYAAWLMQGGMALALGLLGLFAARRRKVRA